jgi:Transglycosylase SLT domain
MQFLQATFDAVVSRHRLPPGGANPPSRYNPHDAIYAAAYYLCDNGARNGRNLYQAIFAYNHDENYVHTKSSTKPKPTPPRNPAVPQHPLRPPGWPSPTPALNSANATCGVATAQS